MASIICGPAPPRPRYYTQLPVPRQTPAAGATKTSASIGPVRQKTASSPSCCPPSSQNPRGTLASLHGSPHLRSDHPDTPGTELKFDVSAVDAFIGTRPPLAPSDEPPPPLVLKGLSYGQYLSVRKYIDGLAIASVGFAKSARLNYDCSSGSLFITCPGVPHEVTSSFPDEIVSLLKSDNLSFYGPIWKDDPQRRIISTKSATVELSLDGKKSSRQPDGSLRLKGDPYPFLVCEVADSQSTKALLKLASKYILGTAGAVKFVILVKLERRREKRKQSASDGVASEGKGRVRSGIEDSNVQMVAVGDEIKDGVDDTVIPPPDGGKAADYSRGLFWVYTYTLGPSSTDPTKVTAKMHCLEQEQEFYPNPASSHLTLTWSSILSSTDIPSHVAGNSIYIPYSLLKDLLMEALQPELPGFTTARGLTFESIELDDSFGEELSSEPSLPEDLHEDPDFRARGCGETVDGPGRVLRPRA